MKLSLTAGFASLLALLAANCILTYRTVSTLQHDQERIAEYQGVRIELGALLNAYVNAETGQRGYVLTGDENYLKPYSAALNDLAQSNGRIKSLLAPLNKLSELRFLMESAGKDKMAELARTIELRKQQGFDAALEVVKTNAGKTSMDRIRELAAEIDEDQKNAMNLVMKETQQRKLTAIEMSTGASAVLAAALIAFLFMTRKNMSERTRFLAQEQEAKLALEKALAAERAAHSEAAHANKLKDEFLAVVSHELRTPLNAIVGWTSLLREGSDPEEFKEGLASIEKNAHAQARLVDDLLDISRIITGKLRVQTNELDLSRIARSVMEGLHPAADAKEIKVTIHQTDESMEVAGDADRLQQIVWNLVSNAIKFTPRGGSVEISLLHVDSDVTLEVKDTGQGINPEFLPRIFDRFSQQDSSSTRGHGGLGLGLSISRHLAELHGGKITASSEGPGKGATFRLQVPVIAVHDGSDGNETRGEESASRENSAPSGPVRSIKNLRILAVDDQGDALDVVNRVLTRAGAEVRTAASVEDALTILDHWHPDLIISDIGMPEQDGYTFIRILRNGADSSLRKVPAIALTAFARESDRHRAIGAGFNDHLTKPVHARALIEKAAEIAGRV